ncbi:MAG TPA: glycosyltransferase [Burkholderiales bacterium]|nr:glycosyltransferase [Burkholderiales bacterium]
MKLVIFGLTVTSSWGNGHATLWRGLLNALAACGHEVTFFERDVPYYAAHRDLREPPGYRVVLYTQWQEALAQARAALTGSDAAIVTSYCPDALAASDLLLEHDVPLRVFYDLDTPITLHGLREQGTVEYIPRDGLGAFDLVLSYTGGTALRELQSALGAKAVEPLYGSVDPALHRPVAPVQHYRADLSYLGTYAPDRQRALDRLFLEPALALPRKRFLIGGAKYPQDFPWSSNIWFVQHVAPGDHAAFYSSAAITLNITRSAMADMGYCPSGRLFEAAACAAVIVSDWWEGLDAFFEPGREILIAHRAEDVIAALALSRGELQRIGEAARRRALAEHTAGRRAQQLIEILSRHAARRASARGAVAILGVST